MAVEQLVAAPKIYTAAVQEMRERGMVTISGLGEIWGITHDGARHYARKGRIKGEYHKDARTRFYRMDSPKPEPRKPGNPGKRPSRGKPYRDISVAPGEQQVPLEKSWAMWPALGYKRSFGWLGANA